MSMSIGTVSEWDKARRRLKLYGLVCKMFYNKDLHIYRKDNLEVAIAKYRTLAEVNAFTDGYKHKE